MADYRPGFAQTMTVGSATTCITKSTWEDNNDVQDVSGNCAGGFKQYIKGQSGLSGSFTAIWDEDAPPALRSGDFFAINNAVSASGTALTCATCIVTKFSMDSDVGGPITWSVSYNTSNAYTIS